MPHPTDNEGGLLGIAASPRFTLDQMVVVYYTTTVDNRVARLRLGQRPTPIIIGVPNSGVHDGGRLAFGPDGYLYPCQRVEIIDALARLFWPFRKREPQ